MTTILISDIVYFGKACFVACDRKCEKAWGIQCRPRVEFDPDDADDMAYLADDECGIAPADPQTYEGGQGKPMYPTRHNKWCMRECERSSVQDHGEMLELEDLSQRVYNQPWKHVAAVRAVAAGGEGEHKQ